MKIKDFPAKQSRNSSDLLMIQDAANDAYMQMLVGDFLAGLSSGGGSGSELWQVITSNYTASNGNRLAIDTSNNGVVITLPELPVIGHTIDLVLVNDLNVYPLTINLNGNLFRGKTEVAVVKGKTFSTSLIYCGGSIGWIASNFDFITARSLVAEILQDAPVGYWRLEETTGVIATNEGSAMSNGTYQSVVLGQPGLAYGSNYSVFFNGTTSKVSFSNTIVSNNQNISLECTVNLSSSVLSGTFISLGNASTGLGIGVGGSTHDNQGNNLIALAETIAWKPTNIAIGLGTHHIGLVYRGATDKSWLFYLDGALVATLGATNINPPTGQGNIGSGTGVRFVNAYIDEVAIYDKELSAARWLVHANNVIK